MSQEYIETVVLDDPLTEARRGLSKSVIARPAPAAQATFDDDDNDNDYDNEPMTHSWLS